MRPRLFALALSLLALCPLALAPALAAPGADDAPARILLLGTYHMHNPGGDEINIDGDDVLAPQRQRELEALADVLAGFGPDKVAVEARVQAPDLVWPQPLDPDALATDANEITQVGQRVAMKAGLDRLYAVDAPGRFDLAPLRAIQAEPGAGHLHRAMAHAQRLGEDMGARLRHMSIPAYLEWLNSAHMIEANHRLYRELVRVSDGAARPGAELVIDWYARNARICARILQLARPGEHMLVLYGVGHVYWLRECLSGVDDVELVDPLPYLRAAGSRLRGE